MIIYYSGSAGAGTGGVLRAEPENILRDKANIMLSFVLVKTGKQDQHKRLPLILKERRKKHDRQSD